MRTTLLPLIMIHERLTLIVGVVTIKHAESALHVHVVS